MSKTKRQFPKFKNMVMVVSAETSSGGYFHIRGRINAFDPISEKLTGIPYTPYEAQGYYHDFQVDSQAHAYFESGKYEVSKLYGWEYEYVPSYVRPENVEIMQFVLLTIQRKMAKFSEIEGSPATFGQYLTRVARALGIDKIVIKRERRQHESEATHRERSLGDAVGDIDHIFNVWQHEKLEYQKECSTTQFIPAAVQEA